MKETEVQLKRIQAKIQQLVKQQQALTKENAQLKEDLAQKVKQSKAHKETVDGLQQQISVMKYSSGDMSDSDKKEFERKINTYVKELDRCIAMLGQ